MTTNNPASASAASVLHEMCYVATAVNLPLQMNPIPDEQAYDFLLRSEANVNRLGFSLMKLDKPKPGQCLVVAMHPNQRDLPSDGYFWQDGESVRRRTIRPNAKDLMVLSRDQGFILGDQFVSMRKRRYQLADEKSRLRFLHFLPVDPKVPRIPVNPAVQKAALQIQQQEAANRLAKGGPQREEDEVSGDEFDLLTERDLASIRFKRNHEFMDELFTPLTTADLMQRKEQPATQEARNTKRQNWLKQQQETAKEIEQAKQHHAEKVARWKESTAQRQAHFERLQGTEPISEEDLNALSAAYCCEFQVDIVPAPIVTRIER